jgi:hypothetical protein
MTHASGSRRAIQYFEAFRVFLRAFPNKVLRCPGLERPNGGSLNPSGFIDERGGYKPVNCT